MSTFSVSRLVIWSLRFWVKTMVKTAWDLDEVSFMFVAATVLEVSESVHQDGHDL